MQRRTGTKPANPLLWLYQNRQQIGGFSDDSYWISTDDTWGVETQVVDFSGGFYRLENKANRALVRCMRIISEIAPVVTSQGKSSSTQATSNPPIANFTGSPTSGTGPLTVSFTDQSTKSPTSWSWNFGDGTTSTQRNPTKVYNSPGTYTVSLTASSSQGSNTHTKSGYIAVSGPPPVAIFPGSDQRSTERQEQDQTGTPGSQGRPEGAIDGKGIIGVGQGGIEYSLTGRRHTSIPIPEYTTQAQGRVVVSITVNRQGEVTRSVAGARGTTTSDQTLWRLAEDAARRARFDVKLNAPEEQTGTITCNFIQLN